MNLFAVSWGLPEDRRQSVTNELTGTALQYPQLDLETLTTFSGRQVHGAALSTAHRAAMPRRYFDQSDSQLVFFDGVLVHRTGDFDANNAYELSVHWEHLSDVLEGRFVVVRLCDERIDLLTDPLGMGQVYCLRQGNAWLVSNSVRVLERIAGVTGLDPLGVSLFVTFDWVGADRTLRPGIRVVPGGQHVTWSGERPEPIIRRFFSRVDFMKRPRSSLTRDRTAALGESLTGMCRTLATSFTRLNCPLTAGRDSRLLAAILSHGELPAKYWTSGDPASTDVVFGQQLAETLGLDHQVSNLPTEDPGSNTTPSSVIGDTWTDLGRKFVVQNDGLASLMLVSNILGQPDRVDRIPVTLSGLGGEIARYFYASGYLHATTAESLLRWLSRHLASDHCGLVRPEAIALTQAYLREFVAECLDHGCAVVDVLDVFYAHERVRRWAGNYGRELAPSEDQFMPFCTRPFIEAAFSMPAEERYVETLHRELTGYLAPALHAIPYLHPWRSLPTAPDPVAHSAPVSLGARDRLSRALPAWLRKPLAQARRALRRSRRSSVVPMYDTAGWLESQRPRIVDVCLSNTKSSMWDFVDRSVFEHLMSNTTDPRERSAFQAPLWAVATIGYYELSSSSR